MWHTGVEIINLTLCRGSGMGGCLVVLYIPNILPILAILYLKREFTSETIKLLLSYFFDTCI